uniref:Basic phospholipase A2 beta-bungarotoxin A2 chain n=1 Tax=Bungarus caeruleus TaxID=132961 RepID=PA2B2_BUNCE|nr:RecName: Full=Basic phospholipase A2 beta-bungarotoxin A2 chain; Short=Beta-BuTX A2 chain; Short=svPLA2; AltName: Full=Phosphatidylcholine 2-acylhydrolase; Flags: Precursor [Bungarus caeruleus]AAL87004.1 beta-bungarotoxin A2 chain precursor [Bungarus caeruleus]
MYPAHLLVLSAVCVSLLGAANIPPYPLNLINFMEMIRYTIPCDKTWGHYADYGCYCGAGGSGTPVDALDRCCYVHDNCYGVAENKHKCNPKTQSCSYKLTKRTIICYGAAGTCGRIVCDCDRTAALCFGDSEYIGAHKNIDTKRHCQ